MNTNEPSLSYNQRMRRIQGAGRILSIIFFTLTVICACATTVLLLGVVILINRVSSAELMTGAANEATATFLSWCCYKLFTRYSHGELFTESVVSSIRRIGYAYILMVLAGAVSLTVLTVLNHSSNIPHPVRTNSVNPLWPIRLFTLAFSGALPAFLIIFIAWVMDEGRKMREEQELTV